MLFKESGYKWGDKEIYWLTAEFFGLHLRFYGCVFILNETHMILLITIDDYYIFAPRCQSYAFYSLTCPSVYRGSEPFSSSGHSHSSITI